MDDDLEILIALGTGDLVVVSEYLDGKLLDRSLAHRQTGAELRDVQPGAEIRIFRLRDRSR